MLVQAIDPQVGGTGTWRAGIQANTNLPVGTPIATFTRNGTYPGQTGILNPALPANDPRKFAHAAIYLGHDSAGNAYILNQYSAHPETGLAAQPATVTQITPQDLRLYSAISH